MMPFFNTAGPVRCDDHYLLPPLERFDLEEVMFLINQKKYFVLHAPRQTGKTSCMLALMEYLNNTGKFKALYFNVEAAQGVREDIKRGIRAIMDEMAGRAEYHLKDSLLTKIKNKILEQGIEDNALNKIFTKWCEKSDLPVVLFIDEIDSLIGDTLISVLRQIRAGYDKRPGRFPQSIILCGIRDVRDYRIHSSKNKEIITGGSAFNIKAKSLRLGNFSKDEMIRLYKLHTKETGQEFTEDAFDAAWELTEGQPWLVNALGYEATFDMKHMRDRSITITEDIIREAAENIIQRRETHIDQLVDKLSEDRLRNIIAPMLAGEDMDKNIKEDEIQYAVDLGLVKRDKNGIRISNGIYSEVIPRELTYVTQIGLESNFRSEWYINSDGSLNMEKLIAAFQEFFRENSESWLERFEYSEAAHQLLLQAFLQRVVNGGGYIFREYGLGRKRTDLLVIWHKNKEKEKFIIELKIRYKSIEKTIDKGLRQTWEYMDKCGSNKGHLVIFDKSKNAAWDEKIFLRKETYKGKNISIWGM
jgi:hypothetical protein